LLQFTKCVKTLLGSKFWSSWFHAPALWSTRHPYPCESKKRAGEPRAKSPQGYNSRPPDAFTSTVFFYNSKYTIRHDTSKNTPEIIVHTLCPVLLSFSAT
jgi:hypothetical protein